MSIISLANTDVFTTLKKWYRSGGDFLIFIAFSLAVTFFIGQEKTIVRLEPFYWAKVGPAIIFPMLLYRETLHALFIGTARPITIMGIVAGLWSLGKGDYSGFIQIALFVWVVGWTCRQDIEIPLRHILALYVGFIVVGATLFLMQPSLDEYDILRYERVESEASISFLDPDNPSGSDEIVILPDQERQNFNINVWGILPFQTAPAYGRWRISVTPNIATSGIFSFLLFCIFLKDKTTTRRYWFALLLSAYFSFLSIIRSILIVTGMLFTTRFMLFLFPKIKWVQSIIIVFFVFSILLLIYISPIMIFYLQENEFVSRVFLRGQTDMSLTDIYRQAYRPWLWQTHVALFWESQFLMGLGSELLQSASEIRINAGQARSDSVSLPTRFLATYGLASIGLLWFLIASGWQHLKNDDIWGAVMVAVLFFLMMNWGSVFHPSSAIFVLSFLVIANGQSAFKN